MMCRDTNRFSLPHAAQQSIMYIFHIKFSPLQFAALSCLLFSVHNRCCGVKLRLPQQEENADTRQTDFPTLPTLFMTLPSSFSFFPRSAASFLPLLSIVPCPQVRGSLHFLLLKPGKRGERRAERRGLAVRLLRPGWLTGLNWF